MTTRFSVSTQWRLVGERFGHHLGGEHGSDAEHKPWYCCTTNENCVDSSAVCRWVDTSSADTDRHNTGSFAGAYGLFLLHGVNTFYCHFVTDMTTIQSLTNWYPHDL